MREIKFRIWEEGPVKEGFKGIMVPYDYIIESSYLIDGLKGKYPLMQFTGLKDKNNKEIYEGDIIIKGKGKYYFIQYSDGGFHAEYVNNQGIQGHGFHISLCVNEFEVIGNIYENKNLLNKEVK